MKNNYFPDWNIPDFSKLAEIARKTQEMMRPIVEAAQRVQEVIRPLVEIAVKYREQITDTLVGIAEIARPFAAIRIMGEAQAALLVIIGLLAQLRELGGIGQQPLFQLCVVCVDLRSGVTVMSKNLSNSYHC